jgi:membrane protease subunit (stomatin/prohibitin family)
MGLFEKIRGEFIDIIEWLDTTNDTIAYRFERHNNEIKMGAKLTVRPGQKAIFVNEGQVGDTFEPGMYTLETQNLPILSTLQGWKYGFNSPFKAEVYFFNTKIFTNLKWGTSSPITVRDPELGLVQVRAFGTYNLRVSNPSRLLQELISTDGLFQVDEINDQIRNMMVTSFATWLGENRTPFADFAVQYHQMGNALLAGMQAQMEPYGLALTQVLVENLSLPPAVQEAIDKRAAMNVIGNLSQYTQYQAANAVEDSANNPNGGSTALDFGVGIAMAQQLTQTMQTPQPNVQPMGQALNAPPPPPPSTQWFLSRDGQNLGPFSASQLLANGLTRQTYVWRNGLANWQFASEVPELEQLLASVPPPPPVA